MYTVKKKGPRRLKKPLTPFGTPVCAGTQRTDPGPVWKLRRDVLGAVNRPWTPLAARLGL